jgi:hypothetical protein
LKKIAQNVAQPVFVKINALPLPWKEESKKGYFCHFQETAQK